MSKQQLLAYPYVEELEYRSKIDPYKMNLMLRSIEESVLRGILRGSESLETLNDLKLGVESSYLALQGNAISLLGYTNIPSGYAFATSFDVVVSGRQDRVAGITTLDWDTNRCYTKVPRYDTDNDGIADQVSPSVQMLVDGTLRSYENKAYNSLNRNNKSFWIESAANGEHNIEIRLPPSINKNFNYFEIIPFPMFGMEILEVKYQDSLSVDQVIFSSGNYPFYAATGPLVMHISPKETNGTFKIKVRCDYGVIGFSSIDFAMVDYKDEVQTTYLKIMNLPSKTGIYTLKTIDIDFYVHEQNAFDEFISEVSLVNMPSESADQKVTLNTISHDDYTFPAGQTLELTDQYMYLKIVMKEHNTTSPVIRGCKLTYEV